MKPNKRQQQAIECVDGAMLIIAGAGSGKTATLTKRIAYMIAEKGVEPRSILALTFTNKAAGEMKERTGQAIGATYHPHMMKNRHLPYMGTFHSFGIYILKEVLGSSYAETAGEIIGLKKDFIIYDESDKLSVMKDIIKNEMGLIEKEYPPRQVAYFISDAKNKSINAQGYKSQVDSNLKEVVATAFEKYEKRLSDNNAVDFDDILGKLLQVLEIPEILSAYQEKYKYIMVDEYQDTNLVQYNIVRLLAEKYGNLAVVGDDWQCLTGDAQLETSSGKLEIKDAKIGDQILSYDGSNSKKYYPVSDVHHSEKQGRIYSIRTLGGHEIKSTDSHIFFANPEELGSQSKNYGVYLMYKKGFGYRIGYTRFKGLTGSGNNIFGLRKRLNGERADYAWLLSVTDSQKEAKYQEQYLSYKYGVPQSVFFARGKLSELDQNDIDALYKNIDTQTGADKIFEQLHLSREHPHVYASASNRNDSLRVNINFLMMGGSEKGRRFGMYRITLHTSHQQVIKVLQENFPQYCRSSRLGIRIDKELASYEKIWNIVQDIQKCLDRNNFEVEIIQRMSFAGKSLLFCPAKNLREGFGISVWNDESEQYEIDEIQSIIYEEKLETVYDIDIERTHNFVANNIVVHNSIYSWRGADMRNIINFKKDYPGAVIIKLEQNYRSTKHIISAANEVIKNNKEALKKELWTDNVEGNKIMYASAVDDRSEANWIADKIKDSVKEGGKYLDNLILYRTNAQSRGLEEALLKNAIPYKVVGGMKFYDRKEVKDILAYLRCILNPHDPVSFKRIINTPSRKIGAKSIEVLDNYRESFGIGYFQVLENIDEVEDMRPAAKMALLDFNRIFSGFTAASEKVSVSELIGQIVSAIGYEEFLRSQFSDDEFESKKENLKELQNVASEYNGLAPREGLSLFLEEVALISDLDSTNEDQDYVILMTIHSSKGLEQERVFVTGLEDGIFPHSRTHSKPVELEEERRLMYVAMTRAKSELFLTRAKERLYFGDYVRNPESRFIQEVPGEHIEEVEMSGGFSFSTASGFGNTSSESTMKVGRAPAVENNVADFRAGEQVQHHKFGIGIIDSLIGEIAEIRFKVGIKKMNIRIAPVKKV